MANDYTHKDVKKQFNKAEHEKAMLHTMKFRAGEAKSKAVAKKKEGEAYTNLQKGHSYSKKQGRYLD